MRFWLITWNTLFKCLIHLVSYLKQITNYLLASVFVYRKKGRQSKRTAATRWYPSRQNNTPGITNISTWYLLLNEYHVWVCVSPAFPQNITSLLDIAGSTSFYEYERENLPVTAVADQQPTWINARLICINNEKIYIICNPQFTEVTVYASALHSTGQDLVNYKA